MTSSGEPASDGCPRVAAARASSDALETAMELADAAARGALLASWKGRRLDAEERDEIVQETLARVLFGITRTDKPVANLQDWVRGTVDLALRERWRRRRSRANATDPTSLDELSTLEPAPPETLLAGERRAAVRACVDALAEPERRMLRLRYEEGLANRAIAERVGRSEKSVERAVPRALRAVRACLERKRVNG